MSEDFNNTLNLPKTDFPMRGNLPQREPEMLDKWEQDRLYYALSEKNKGKPSYTLHDGPPYANGNIHMGTAMNKVLKDIIVKYKSMTGFDANYVPGWDCHGLPIELKAIKQLGVDSGKIDPVTVSSRCPAWTVRRRSSSAWAFGAILMTRTSPSSPNLKPSRWKYSAR